MSCKLFTASYSNIKSDLHNNKLVSISGDRGKNARFNGEYANELAPKKAFWTIWHDNIGKISEDENIKYYIREYYNQVLSKLDPEAIVNKYHFKILLCYEDNIEFCHRHIVAFWLELFLGIEIPEIKIYEDGNASIIPRPQELKKIVEEVLKENIDMKGYHSLEAFYKFDKATKMEEYSLSIMDEEPEYSSTLISMSSQLLLDAKEIEKEYIDKHQVIIPK